MIHTQKTFWPSPAKLNLMLHIVGKNEQNYHLLQTVFQPLDVGDEIEITVTQDPSIKLSCNLAELENENNLAYRAAIALQQQTQTTLGAHIHLNKKLPMGGGVGGGSSNAATLLVALNQLWQCQLSATELAQIGVSLGADVPVFVHGFSAWAEGIGEKLTPIELPETHYLIIHPECFVSTAKIFSHSALTRDCEISTIRDFLAQGGPYVGNNVMEPVVLQLYPEVEEALSWLKQYNDNARLTGSGSCVFAPFDNKREMSKIAALCKWPHFMAQGVNQSPLHNQKPI